MKYSRKMVVLNPTIHVFVIWAALCTYLLLAGCAAKRPKPVAFTPLPPLARPVDLRFESPLVVTVPKQDPVTAEEHIRCGLFYYDQQRFQEAAKEFGMAGSRIVDPHNPLYRDCLLSKAICDLNLDDKPAFLKDIRELKTAYTKYDLVVVKQRDERLRVVFELYDRIMQTGNY